MSHDISSLTARLKSVVIARVQFDQQFAALLEELGVSDVKEHGQIMALVDQLADPARWKGKVMDASVTEADARELLRHTDR